ncbi:MAG: D-tyrosyl-tRNA(Tyr) deacylase [Clostridia bacterium]|nr:D-tyrosyl-tRNA(Tyr) deacylase [Clostridia bacterium]
MKIVLQRVKNALVRIDGEIYSEIGEGLLALVGISETDNEKVIDFMCEKMANLRIFRDENDKMNLSCLDVKGEILMISNFTLYADASHGRRPNFLKAAKPDIATKLFDYSVLKTSQIVDTVKTGVFGADMKVELLNNGPVTIILDSEEIMK